MPEKTYKSTYCVKCRIKTGWVSPVILRMASNNVPGLRGHCCRCKFTKYTFVTAGFYKTNICKNGKFHHTVKII